MSGKILTTAQIAEFEERGFLIVRDFYEPDDIIPIQRGIYDVIGLLMSDNAIRDDRGPFLPERFDAGFQELIQRNRAWGGIVYDAVKQIPAFFRLVAHPAHETIVRQIRTSAIPGIAGGGHGIRIDNPFEDTFRALWHQEYPAQLRSVDGLVYWSPLVPVTEELGPIQFCPGSHREGPLPVLESDPDHSGRSGAYALVLSEQDKVLSRYQPVAPLTSPGDLVIVDFLTLHASGHNRGTRSRWSMQFRYFNFAESTGRSHSWRGSFAAGVDFRTVHPELCARPEEK